MPGTKHRYKRGDYYLLVAQQRGWSYSTRGCRWIDDDPFSLNPDEPLATPLWAYDVDTHCRLLRANLIKLQ